MGAQILTNKQRLPTLNPSIWLQVKNQLCLGCPSWLILPVVLFTAKGTQKTRILGDAFPPMNGENFAIPGHVQKDHVQIHQYLMRV